MKTNELHPFMNDEPLWRVSDVATYLSVSASWVYMAAEDARLPVVRIGRNLRFQPDKIRAYGRGESPKQNKGGNNG